jgi:hypothetical protein
VLAKTVYGPVKCSCRSRKVRSFALFFCFIDEMVIQSYSTGDGVGHRLVQLILVIALKMINRLHSKQPSVSHVCETGRALATTSQSEVW